MAGPSLADESTGLVSVIVPCYNIESYLAECIESVLEQSHDYLEVIAVDDGSTDATGDMLDQWAEQDRRIQVVHRKNGGLGAARNTGLNEAAGQFITFVDADDILTPGAIERFVSAIDRTGSDFVSAVADRFDETHRWRAALYRRGFENDLDRTHMFDRSSLVYDHIVCSKLFRRSFWDEHEFRFPEGTLFEDMEIAIRAHCVAESVDLIAEPAYLWRSRPADDPSITQDRRRPGGVSARFAAIESIDRYLESSTPANVWRRHGMRVLESDVPLYARELRSGDDRFRTDFVAAVQPVLRELSPAAWVSTGTSYRLLGEALLAGDPSTAIRLSTYIRAKGSRERVAGLLALPWGYGGRIVRSGVARRIKRRPS